MVEKQMAEVDFAEVELSKKSSLGTERLPVKVILEQTGCNRLLWHYACLINVSELHNLYRSIS